MVTSLMVKSLETEIFRLSISNANAMCVIVTCTPHSVALFFCSLQITLNITKKIVHLQVFSPVKPVIPLHDRHCFSCFVLGECSPDSWCAVLYSFILVVFSITTQLSSPPALAQCWQQHWQGRDWTAWLEGLLKLTHCIERREITLSIQPGSIPRHFLTPGSQCRDALVASGA